MKNTFLKPIVERGIQTHGFCGRAWLRHHGFQSRFYPTSQGRVHTLEAVGTGALPPVLVVHGFGASSVDYMPLLLRFLKHTRKVVGIDLIGHGLSDRPHHTSLGHEQLRGVFEAITAAMPKPFLLFGNSLGGLVAMRYASEHPKHVAALLVSSPAGAPMSAAGEKELFRKLKIENYKDARDLIDVFFTGLPWIKPFYALGMLSIFQTPHLRAIVEKTRAEDFLSSQELSRLSMPVFFSWGQEERLLPQECFMFFKEHLPAHAHIETPEGYGHCAFMEKPDALMFDMLRFFSAHFSGDFTDGSGARKVA